jgi:FKBP-type peptidyl-prolyl cis-trans isomerase 2
MRKVKLGDNVTVNYTGKLEDGSIFDTSLTEGREPLSATLGQGQLIEGFENGLLEMSVGESKTIQIDPEQAYGLYNPELRTKINRTQFPPNVQVGETLQGNSPNGPIIVKVWEVDEETVTIDANHPLAGQKLVFEVELTNIY